MRIGDIICINYIDEIHILDIKTKQKQDADDKSLSKKRFLAPENIKKTEQQFRNLTEPDYKYKGLLFSDGVTDIGIKVMPQNNSSSQNAANLFKQCLFRIEIKQDC